MNLLEKIEKIKKIKSHDEPPRNEGDYFNMRKPWDKFGGFCHNMKNMKWIWRTTEQILELATDEDIEKAYNEFYKE